ncbi:MAG: tRNA (adenosine(37)-N6)-threonylcarbamoyltransferase complex ATPase subunit type 1 TsaE [Actinobacteria bacterium]|nr:tRNA (adenosine(37)-N6)-threonylcarbamoyltransferase complex ATPase subunit type 1 TsaE [Actinomycetota bacterium]
MSNQVFSDKDLLREITTYSPEETMEVGRMIASVSEKGDFIALSGDLGSGKTTFVKGFVSAFSSPVYVKSPSFTIVNEYELENGATVFHIDLYRVDSSALDDIGFVEFLDRGIVIVEWSEKMLAYVPEKSLLIRFEIIGSDARKIYFYGGLNWKQRLTLATNLK